MSKKPKIKVLRTSEENNRNVSIFHILVNTNKTIEDGADEEKLLYDLEKLGKHFDQFLKIVHGGSPFTGEEEIEFAFNTETGNKQHRLHGHIAVKVTHDTRVQINAEKLQKWGRKYGYPNVHGNWIKNGNDLMTILKNYSRKNYK